MKANVHKIFSSTKIKKKNLIISDFHFLLHINSTETNIGSTSVLPHHATAIVITTLLLFCYLIQINVL